MGAIEQRREQKRQAAVAIAIKALNCELEDLKAKLESDEELADLWLRGLAAAERARMQDKLRVFGAILAAGVNASRPQRMVVGAVLRVWEDLEAEHIEILMRCEAAALEAPVPLADGSAGRPGATPASLAQALPHLAEVMPILLSDLTRMTLIENTLANTWAGIGGEVLFVPTPLGAELLRVLRQTDASP